MGFWDGKSAEEEKLEEAHNHGQEDGSEDVSAFVTPLTAAIYEFFDGKEVADAYKAGLENGSNNQPKDD